MPILLSVAALVVFLILFWPSSHGKKGHAKGHGGGQGSSSVTERGGSGGGGSPVGGGGGSARSAGKGESWWYQEKSGGGDGRKEGWWYQEEGKGSKTARAAESGKSSSPVGGADERPNADREAQSAKKSGPDEFWWRD
jgi:hypothetical protein